MDDTGSSLTSLVESNNVFKISSSVGSRDCWCAVKLLERQQSIIEGVHQVQSAAVTESVSAVGYKQNIYF